MAKDKTKNKDKGKGPKSVPNKHLHARISFLQQAATYLATQKQASPEGAARASKPNSHQGPSTAECRGSTEQDVMDWIPGQEKTCGDHSTTMTSDEHPIPRGVPYQLSSHLPQIARKSLTRLHPSVKRTFCKVCNGILIEGQSCSKRVENLSRGGKKQHADVLVIECLACGAKKRFPFGAAPQLKKDKRVRTTQDSQDAAMPVE